MKRPTFFLLCSLLAASVAHLHAEDDWTFSAGFDGDIFPSAIIVSSMLKADEDADDHTLGDPFGAVAAEIVATADDQDVEVTVAATKLLEASSFRGKLPKKGESYFVAPILKFDYDRLLDTRQPVPDTITVKVKLGGKDLGEKTQKVIVRSINDCLYSREDENGEACDCSYMFAAYVNENHPVVQAILAEAMKQKDSDGKLLTEAISGYQGDPDDVRRQVEAVYQAIKKRGIKYSSITQSSIADKKTASQHVRLLGDSAKQAAANCVDGSVLFASVLRKMELDTYLVSVPGHMFMGVWLDEDHNEHLEIETTMVGSDPFDAAVETGGTAFEEAKDKFDDESETDYQMIEIDEARQMGVNPIKDSEADAGTKSPRR